MLCNSWQLLCYREKMQQDVQTGQFLSVMLEKLSARKVLPVKYIWEGSSPKKA